MAESMWQASCLPHFLPCLLLSVFHLNILPSIIWVTPSALPFFLSRQSVHLPAVGVYLSHSCFFFLLAVDSHSYLSLHPNMQPEAFCHQNVTEQEVNSVALKGRCQLPRTALILKLWMQTCHAVSCWHIAYSTNYHYYASKKDKEDCWLRKVLLRTSSTVSEINCLKAVTWRHK